jgi:hypothetical protein
MAWIPKMGNRPHLLVNQLAKIKHARRANLKAYPARYALLLENGRFQPKCPLYSLAQTAQLIQNGLVGTNSSASSAVNADFRVNAVQVLSLSYDGIDRTDFHASCAACASRIDQKTHRGTLPDSDFSTSQTSRLSRVSLVGIPVSGSQPISSQ